MKRTILIYGINDTIDMLVKENTIWANQNALQKLFGVTKPVISKHLSYVFQHEAITTSTITDILPKGYFDKDDREIIYYPLEAIIAIGLRINSPKAVQFRKWALQFLKQEIEKQIHTTDESTDIQFISPYDSNNVHETITSNFNELLDLLSHDQNK